MVEDKNARLGRGLAALIGDSREDAQAIGAGRAQRTIPIEFLRPNPNNPRKNFVEDELTELADSIREKGIIQPILVRAVTEVADAYEIIAGERRWRAAQRAGVHDVPVRIIEASDQDSLELAIIENVQRSDLNAIEEALGYDRLASEFSYSQADVARITGKSRSHVANTLRLLKLPDSTQTLVIDGSLSAGHARALLAVADPEAVAQRIISEGLTVRDVEALSQEKLAAQGETGPSKKPRKEKDPDTRALENVLTEILGLIVSIKHKGETGEVSIKYKTLDQLDLLCKKLKN
jgi:ParB family chromosome partitioning protein